MTRRGLLAAASLLRKLTRHDVLPDEQEGPATETQMSVPRLAILLGHSHTGSLVHAVTSPKDPKEIARNGRDPLHVAMYEAFKFDGKPPYLSHTEHGTDCFNPAILEAAAPYVASLGPPVYLTSFGGNDWAVLTLMQHQRPFDFVLPSRPDLPIQGDAELVTFEYIKAILKSLTDTYNYLYFLLRQAVTEPVYSFIAPPPIKDDRFVQEMMDDFFRKNTGFSQVVSPSALRMKMWLLQRELQMEICTLNGITVFDVPPEAQTDDGYLRPEFYGRDATHANPAYGHLLVKQIQDTLNVDYHTYHWFS